MPVLQPPPFRIYLLRHARAAWPAPGEKDFDRRLDDTGISEAEIIADRAADKGYLPDIVLSSTAMRCRETAEAIRRAFNDTFEINYVDEMYNAEASVYLDLIFAQAGSSSVMLIGHNPTMEAITAKLIGQQAMEAELPSGFPTAGLAMIDAKAPDGDHGFIWTVGDFLSP